MKIIIFFILISFQSNAQLVGKTYLHHQRTTCKDQIGTFVMFDALEFEKDSVIVFTKVDAYVDSVTSKEYYEKMYDHLKKRYSYKLKKGVLTIENYNKYNIEEGKLIGLKGKQIYKLEK